MQHAVVWQMQSEFDQYLRLWGVCSLADQKTGSLQHAIDLNVPDMQQCLKC